VHKRSRTGGRRGATILEAVISAGLALLVLIAAGELGRTGVRLWHSSQAHFQGRNYLEFATERIAEDVREALSIDLAQSGADHLTVTLPLVGSDGEYVSPLASGARLTYYLSDSSGDFSAVGNVLWRQVDGVPDAGWALHGGRPVVALANGGLQFIYGGDSPPRDVTLNLTAATSSGSINVSQALSTTIFLRNREIADQSASSGGGSGDGDDDDDHGDGDDDDDHGDDDD